MSPDRYLKVITYEKGKGKRKKKYGEWSIEEMDEPYMDVPHMRQPAKEPSPEV